MDQPAPSPAPPSPAGPAPPGPVPARHAPPAPAGHAPPAPAVAPGRKRSEESRLAILTAAGELLGEVGFAGLTIEGIAARSGAGKQTIYRWWPSKADVLLDALTVKSDLHIPIPDEGSYEADLRSFLRSSFRLGSDPRIVAVLRTLMAQAQIDPGFGERFRDSFLRHRREALAVLVARARERGDLPPIPAGDLVADIVFGVIWYRVLARAEPLDDRLPDELTAVLARYAE